MLTAEIMHIPFRKRSRSRRLWSRLRGMARAFDGGFGGGALRRSVAVKGSVPEAMPSSQTSAGNAVLEFPVRGEALLVTLAHVLRERFGEQGPDCDPSLFTISRGAACRLTIGRGAYVEFHRNKSRAPFLVAVEVEPDTTVSVHTPDFSTVARMVVHYVRHERRDAAKLEAAS